MIPAVIFHNNRPSVTRSIPHAPRSSTEPNLIVETLPTVAITNPIPYVKNSQTDIKPGVFLIFFTLISLMILMIFVIKFIFDTDKSFKEDAKVQREIDKLKLAHGEYMVEQMKKLLEKDSK